MSVPPASNQTVSAKFATTVFLTALIVPLAVAYTALSLGSVSLVYRWFLLVHIGSLLGFMLSHGAPALVALRMPAPTSADSLTLLSLARDRLVVLSMGTSLGLVLSTGVSLGLMGGFWNQGWIWATLASAIVVTFVMSFLGRRQFDKALDQLKNGGQVQPGRRMETAAVGFLGLVFILWLVLFKPF